jgi:hypothetical protein
MMAFGLELVCFDPHPLLSLSFFVIAMTMTAGLARVENVGALTGKLVDSASTELIELNLPLIIISPNAATRRQPTAAI